MQKTEKKIEKGSELTYDISLSWDLLECEYGSDIGCFTYSLKPLKVTTDKKTQVSNA